MNEKIKVEYERHQQALENFFQEFIKENLTIPVGTKFLYEGELCTVAGAILYPPRDLDLFQELSAGEDIWLLLDIPGWHIGNEPDSKVAWSLGSFNRVLGTRIINIIA